MKWIQSFFSDTLVTASLVLIFCVVSCSDNSSDGDIDNVSDTTLLSAILVGGTESDPDGSGNVTIMINLVENEVCYDFQISNIEDPRVAHIHYKGSGFIAVGFDVQANGLEDCFIFAVEDANDILTEVVTSPQNFYVNVHNEPYPSGAIRGDLMK